MNQVQEGSHMLNVRTRCRAGDIALVTSEDPGCESNIGRFVIVQEAMTWDDELGVLWAIRSVTTEPWICFAQMQLSSLTSKDIGPGSRYDGRIFQADKWLMPVRDAEVDGGGTTVQVERTADGFIVHGPEMTRKERE